MKSNDNKRDNGRFVDLDDDVMESSAQPRKAKVFMPDLENDLSNVPQSISGSENDITDHHYPGIGLEALPIKGIKQFGMGLIALLLVIMGWEIYDIYQALAASHWSFGATFAALVGFVALLAGRTCFSFFSDKENMSALADIQQQTDALKDKTDKGGAKAVINQLSRFYVGKPQSSDFEKSITSLPDYNNDREAILHIERVFVEPLDKAALARVSKHSVNTSVIVAVSPWASVDMLLALWRSMKMIDEVGQIYGMRPSLSNRYKLLRQVIKYLAFIGVSEVVITELMQDFGTSSLAGITGARLSQGVSAGVYTSRIGLAAIEACRPIRFNGENKPKLKDLIKGLLQKVKNND